jgi:RNA polymerase sigma-70 factor (ECF subfamily)
VELDDERNDVPDDLITTQFEEQRPRLRAVAYRMLGSATDADDAVQEAWLRLDRSGAGDIVNLQAWLTTVVGRVALDMLRARDRRREDYLGGALVEPLVEVDVPDGDPAREAELAESVGVALHVVLDTLTPRERVAFVLHDTFAVPFGDIAAILDSTPDAVRQLASRARRRVRGAPAGDAGDGRRHALVHAFLAAAREGDFGGLLAMLDPDVVFRQDAGPGRRTHDPIVGAEAVAQAVVDRGRPFAALARPAVVNGGPGVVVEAGDRLIGVCGITVSGGRIAELDLVTDQQRLRGARRREPGS